MSLKKLQEMVVLTCACLDMSEWQLHGACYAMTWVTLSQIFPMAQHSKLYLSDIFMLKITLQTLMQ